MKFGDRWHYYDRQGRPISEEQYVDLHRDPSRDYKRVALTHVTDGIEVSTVWLGIDHEWRPSMPPLIFETMVFVALDEPKVVFGHTLEREGTETYRWSTEVEAIEGHLQVVRELTSTLAIDDMPPTVIHRSTET